MIASVWWWHCLLFSSFVTPEPSRSPLFLLTACLSARVWWISTNASLKAITRGAVWRLRMKRCSWGAGGVGSGRGGGEETHSKSNMKCGSFLLFNFMLVKSHFCQTLMLFLGGNDLGCVSQKTIYKWNNRPLIESSPLPRMCCFKLCDKNMEERPSGYFNDRNSPLPLRAISTHSKENIQTVRGRKRIKKNI